MSLANTLPPTHPTSPYGPIDILPELSSFRPHASLVVTFTSSPSGDSDPSAVTSAPITYRTNAGEKLTWQQTQSQPSIVFSAESDHKEATYTIIMTDPDAPTPHDTKYAYWRHWIQPGLRPSSSASSEAKSDKGPLTEYLAPGKKDPLADAHRYILLLYREPSPGHPYHSLSKNDVGAEHFEARRAFDAKTWIEKNELELVAVEWFWGTG